MGNAGGLVGANAEKTGQPGWHLRAHVDFKAFIRINTVVKRHQTNLVFCTCNHLYSPQVAFIGCCMTLIKWITPLMISYSRT